MGLLAARRPRAEGRAAGILKRLETVLARSPAHVGAIHLYIHLVEASDRPERAEPYADKLAALMPGAGHIVHMPSHIYYRVGRYLDLLDANDAAQKADETYLAQTGAEGVYPLGYYSHNIHFALVSAQMLGERDVALAAADKLDRWLGMEVAAAIPIAQPVKAAPYFAWAQYGEPQTVLALPRPAGAPPYVEAMWHYARGVAFSETKDFAAARAEADAIDALEKGSDWSTMERLALPGARDPAGRAAGRACPHRRGPGRHGDRDQEVRIGGRGGGRHPLHGAALLVLSGAPVAGRRPPAGRQGRRGCGTVQGGVDKAQGSPFALYGLVQAAKAKGDAAATQAAEEKLKAGWRGDPAFLSLGRL